MMGDVGVIVDYLRYMFVEGLGVECLSAENVYSLL